MTSKSQLHATAILGLFTEQINSDRHTIQFSNLNGGGLGRRVTRWARHGFGQMAANPPDLI
eukprot:105374-Pelagomonas_calceolata.AAC.1